MDRVVLGSHNVKKLAEMTALLTPLNISLAPLSDYTEIEAVESGLSFVENAILKARYAARASQLPAISDDSGLCVDALNGMPGIYSARFGGDVSYVEKMQQLIQAIKVTGSDSWQAHFVCVLVYVAHEKDPCPIIAQGRLTGRITSTLSGEKGFGYDPCFYLNEFGCTMAELAQAQKNTISHRALATIELMAQLSLII